MSSGAGTTTIVNPSTRAGQRAVFLSYASEDAPQLRRSAQPCGPRASRCGSTRANCEAATRGTRPYASRSSRARCSSRSSRATPMRAPRGISGSSGSWRLTDHISWLPIRPSWCRWRSIRRRSPTSACQIDFVSCSGHAFREERRHRSSWSASTACCRRTRRRLTCGALDKMPLRGGRFTLVLPPRVPQWPAAPGRPAEQELRCG
jgi:hypothetical protein